MSALMWPVTELEEKMGRSIRGECAFAETRHAVSCKTAIARAILALDCSADDCTRATARYER